MRFEVCLISFDLGNAMFYICIVSPDFLPNITKINGKTAGKISLLPRPLLQEGEVWGSCYTKVVLIRV